MAIISCFVVLPLITGGASDVNQGIILKDEDQSAEIEDKEDQYSEEDEDYDEEEFSRFEDMSNIELLSFALDKLYNGKGFNSTYTQDANMVVSAMGSKINVPQRCTGTIVRSGKNSLQEYYYYSDYSGLSSDQLKRFYQYDYVNRDENSFTQGKTWAYDYKKLTKDMSRGSTTTMTYDEAISRFCLFYGDQFPIVTNAKKGDLIVPSVKGNYKTIEVTYNVQNLPNSVKDLYGITGQLKNINYQSLKMTYKIDLRNGKMVSMKRVEKISATATGFASEMTTTTTQNFKSVDEDQTIVLP